MLNKKLLKHGITSLVLVMMAALWSGCVSSLTRGYWDYREPEPALAEEIGQSQPQQQGETQLEKFHRLFAADSEKLIIGDDGKTTIESIEAAFHPITISSISEITDAKLTEPGKPYYFKLRAIYKGYDASAEKARLQDIGSSSQNGGVLNSNTMTAIFGVDTNVYSVDYSDVEDFPTEANCIATFYLVAIRFTEQGNESGFLIRFVRDIEKTLFDPAKFITTSGTHYITVEDAHVPTQEDVMRATFLGSAATNASSNVFDPVIYPLVDLFDARSAMNKKDRMNDYTFPTVRVKYVSEVIFKGQTNTTITVSTTDNSLTERMTFEARTSSLRNGDKVRVYYTIAKDPLEEWEVQAIEKL
jgi:hypothetical protein